MTLLLRRSTTLQNRPISYTTAHMARLNRLSRISDNSLPDPPITEPKLVAFEIKNPPPQRQLSLLAITTILNTLLWSSTICAIIALFQLASDSPDHTNILPGVLTLVSVSNVDFQQSLSTDSSGYCDNCIYCRAYNVLGQAKSSDLSATRRRDNQKDHVYCQPSSSLTMCIVAVDSGVEYDLGSKKAKLPGSSI